MHVPPLLQGSLLHSLSSVQLPSSGVETQPAGQLSMRADLKFIVCRLIEREWQREVGRERDHFRKIRSESEKTEEGIRKTFRSASS